MLVTNNTDISLSLAVWLLHDEYDYDSADNYISVTRLMRPLRQIVLPMRNFDKKSPDLEDYIARALGKSLHDSIEKAWKNSYKSALAMLGYPEEAINRVMINPTLEQLQAAENPIPVYLEQRDRRKIKVGRTEYTVGGKFDIVLDGIVHDNKSTSVWKYILRNNDDEYALQMSQYRWINAASDHPKITQDFGRVNFIFTDWQKFQSKQIANYPTKRTETIDVPLLSLEETEAWIVRKLELYEKFKNTPEPLLPECSDEELWRSETKYKYYADATKTSGKSTKNFDSLKDANAFLVEKGNKGIVLTVPGEPKRCGYCDAFDVCSQRKRYFPDND